jgi:signal transduction histidine kinase
VTGCITSFVTVGVIELPTTSDPRDALGAFQSARYGVTLVFLAAAVLVPAYWHAHVALQLASLAFLALRLAEPVAVVAAENLLVSRALGLFWACLFCNLGVVIFTRLQRSEFAARQLLSHANEELRAVNEQLVRESSLRRRYLDGLVRVGISATGMDPALQARSVLDEMIRLLGAQRAFLHLIRADGAIVFRAGRSASGEDVEAPRVLEGSDWVHLSLRMWDRDLGRVSLERPGGAAGLSPSDQDFLKALASHASVALETLHNAEELRSARDRALDASRAKDAFLQTMSHELRTPLNAVMGFAELLIEDLEQQGSSEALADAKQIRSSAVQLLGVISDILELTKLEAEREPVTLTTFSVTEALSGVLAGLKAFAEANGNVLRWRVDDEVDSMTSDRGRVEILLRKIVENACKFTRRGTIECQVSREERDGVPWMRFRVTDTGIGMTGEQIGRCFEPFYQADPSVTRVYGGAGLGLTTALRFCEALGGEIAVHSTPGAGTAVEVRLPASGASPRSAAE